MCGPASLVSLLDYYGVKKTEKQLAKLCNSTLEYGTSPASLVKTLEGLGFPVRATENGTWSDLKRLIDKDIPVLIDWWSDHSKPAGGHYALAYKITPESIYLMDPEIGDYRRMAKQRFLRNWYDFTADTNKPVRRWYLYIKEEH